MTDKLFEVIRLRFEVNEETVKSLSESIIATLEVIKDQEKRIVELEKKLDQK